MPQSQFDVIVVGAGAAGLTAAIGLARAGVGVALVEAAAFPGAENWSGCVYFCENLAHPDILGPDGVEALAWERRLVERGFFTTDGYGLLGATYRDPDAFRHCYTVLRPIFDHHLAQIALRHGVALLTSTTAESLMRHDRRVIGVCTQRGPLYADLVFLAEGDASHLVTREGYEQTVLEREPVKYLQGIKEVWELPAGAIEERFGVGPEQGVAYEMLLRNGTLRGKPVHLNMGGFVYANRQSLSIGMVLPADNLSHDFDGDPNLLMEWFETLPALRPWLRDGRRGAFGAKLIRGGGIKDVPTLIDDGLAIGGAASALGIDFPYPNFTGPANAMGSLLVQAVRRIRAERGSFSWENLRRYYLEPLQQTHYWQDVEFLRHWPGYVKKTTFFFDKNIDLTLGSAYLWTRHQRGMLSRWREWLRLLTQFVSPAENAAVREDTRHLVQALRMRSLWPRTNLGHLLLDGTVNALRDLFGARRPGLGETGTVRLHYTFGGEPVPAGQVPRYLRGWFRRNAPVLGAAARRVYENLPTPLYRKLQDVSRLFARQVNLRDVLNFLGAAAITGLLGGCAIVWGRLRQRLRSPAAKPAKTPLLLDYARPARQTVDLDTVAGPAAQHWEGRLGPLAYQTVKASHIHVLWPQHLENKDAVVRAGLWHVCPAHVYEARLNPAGQLQVVVNYENCIKCETCWRLSDLVDWGRDGRHRFVYAVTSPVVTRLLDDQETWGLARPPLPRQVDPWAISATAAPALEPAALAELHRLVGQLDGKLREFDRALGEEPRTVDPARAEFLRMLVNHARKLVQDVADVLSTLPAGHQASLGPLVKLVRSMAALMAERQQHVERQKYAWAAADGRQLRLHHLAGVRRLLAPAHAAETNGERERRATPAASLQGDAPSLGAKLDELFLPSAWRDLEQQKPLTPDQSGGLLALLNGLPVPEVEDPGLALSDRRRKELLVELGRRDPSLAYRAASHLWARDLCHLAGMPLDADAGWTAFGWETGVEHSRYHGEALFVPDAGEFIVYAIDRLFSLPRNALPHGVAVESLGTIGLRGCSPQRVRWDVPLTETVRVDVESFQRRWHAISSADLTAIALGMADLLCRRAVDHATSRVQFPGLFWDEEARDTIGKFGAIKKMLADMAARRYLIETLSEGGDDPLAKAVAAEALGSLPGSVTYDACQVFGGTGYSEDDMISKYFRDGSAWRFVGAENVAIYRNHGRLLTGSAEPAETLLPIPDEQALSDIVRRLQTLVAEWEEIAKVQVRLSAVVGSVRTLPEKERATLFEAVGRQAALLKASKLLLARTQARLEASQPAEVEVALLRVWLQFVTAESLAFQKTAEHLLHPPQTDFPAPATHPLITHAEFVAATCPYESGDFLVKPTDPAEPRFVPEIVGTDPQLTLRLHTIREQLNDQFGAPRDGLVYERYVEERHRPDEADLDFCRRKGYFRTFIPKSHGGEAWSKVEYYLLTTSANRLADVAISLTIQVNSSLGTTPVLIPREKDLPRAQKDLEQFLADEALQRDLAERLPRLEFANDIQEIKKRLDEGVFSSPALKVLTQRFAGLWKKVESAADAFDTASAPDLRAKAAAAWQGVCRQAPEYLGEIKRRREAADLFLRWVAGGQISAFALTEPSAGSDTARVATRATLCSVPVEVEPDGALWFIPVGGKEPRYLLDAARLEFRPEKELLRPYYHWSDKDASPLMYDEYDYETDDPSGMRYYQHGSRRVYFTDIAQVRNRDGKPCYDYWELTGSKMWITNGRMCGILCLYAKTAEGVTGFIVDRHAEGLVVGKDEAKMGQNGSPTNELSLQKVRVPRENVIGLEGRGQVNALETLNAGRAGIAMTSMAYIQDLEERSRAVAEKLEGEPAEALAGRLRDLAEERFIAEAVAFEVVGRAEHKQTKSYRLEGSIAKMLVSELYLSAIRLAEEVTGVAGQTHDFLVEKRKRDARVLTIYEGTNEIQRFFILRDLVNEVAPRWAKQSLPEQGNAGGLAGELEALKVDLRRRTQAALEVFGPQLAQNPNLQPSGFLLAEAVAWIKAADSVLGRLAWLVRRPNTEAALEVGRRAFARCAREAQARLERFDPELARLRAGFYNPTVRAASLLMGPVETPAPEPPLPVSTRPLSVLVILDPPTPGVPRPTVTAGRLVEPFRVFHESDRAALEVALRLRDALGEGARLQVATVGRRATGQLLREVLSLDIETVRLVVTEHEAVAPDAAARALAKVLRTESPFDLILGGAGEGDDGLLARLTAEVLGVSFTGTAEQISLLAEGRDTELALIDGDDKRRRLRSLPAFVAVEDGLPLREFTTGGYLKGLAHAVRVEFWPAEVEQRPLTYVDAAPAVASEGEEPPHAVGPREAGRLVLGEVGAGNGRAAEVSPYEGDVVETREPNFAEMNPPFRVLAVLGADAEGALHRGAEKTLAAARLLAREGAVGVLLLSPADEKKQRRAIAQLRPTYSGPVLLLPVKEEDEGIRCRILAECWDGLGQTLTAVVGEVWCESAFATLGTRSSRACVALRVRGLAPEGDQVRLDTVTAAGRLGVRQTWRPDSGPTCWLTVARDAQVAPAEIPQGELRVWRWKPALQRFYRQEDVRRMLDELKVHTGLVRLSDAEYIIDVGFGVGNRDGYEAVIEPLERALRELGVRDVVVGGSRKVTEELHLLPNDRQIGQSGVSVNPRLLLAIGVSGAPQHLNYIGGRATIVAFNRDPEAPLMTLNQRQSQPRVFPVLGDLFETVPALIAALRQQPNLREPAG